jgi:rhodanese-related sulfurtransferase
MEAANAVVPKITPTKAREMIASGNALLVDVRDASEVDKNGKAAGAVHVSRGMLEFRADPESPAHDKNFTRDKRVILYCGSGGRAALAGKLLKDMGRRLQGLGRERRGGREGLRSAKRVRFTAAGSDAPATRLP